MPPRLVPATPVVERDVVLKPAPVKHGLYDAEDEKPVLVRSQDVKGPTASSPDSNRRTTREQAKGGNPPITVEDASPPKKARKQPSPKGKQSGKSPKGGREYVEVEED